MTGTTLGLGVQHQVSWIAGTPGLTVLYNAIEHWVSWCMAGTTGPVVYHMAGTPDQQHHSVWLEEHLALWSLAGKPGLKVVYAG